MLAACSPTAKPQSVGWPTAVDTSTKNSNGCGSAPVRENARWGAQNGASNVVTTLAMGPHPIRLIDEQMASGIGGSKTMRPVSSGGSGVAQMTASNASEGRSANSNETFVSPDRMTTTRVLRLIVSALLNSSSTVSSGDVIR